MYLVLGGVLSPRGHLPRGVSAQGEGGVCLGGGVCPGGRLPQCMLGYHTPGTRHTPPWTEFLTHASENITLPQTSFAGGNEGRKVNAMTQELDVKYFVSL